MTDAPKWKRHAQTAHGRSALGSDVPRVLVIPNTLFFPPYLDEPASSDAEPENPRNWIGDVSARIDYLDQRLLTNPRRWRKRLYRRMPMWVVQVLEAFRVGKDYDVVFVWSLANVALTLAALLRCSGRQIVIVALLTRVSEPKKAWLLRRLHPQIARIILPPVTQREFAIEKLGVPPAKIVGLPWTLDSTFWRPQDPSQSRSMICAAGGEMRDYRTLVEALRGLNIPCHIAGVLDTSRPDWWNSTVEDRHGEEAAPPHVTFGTMSPTELRALYERSRLVVVPLKETNSDNGITSMNEAWSMGRPVIVSEVAGQRDAFVGGREGLWVPQGDAEALRAAIVSIWEDQERADAMGAAGQRRVARDKGHRVFSEGISLVISDAANR